MSLRAGNSQVILGMEDASVDGTPGKVCAAWTNKPSTLCPLPNGHPLEMVPAGKVSYTNRPFFQECQLQRNSGCKEFHSIRNAFA